MIRRVRVRGYKSLADAEVRFPGPLTVVIGANASGKTNLMDALGLLSRMALAPTLEEAFREHRGRIAEAFGFGPGGLRESLARETLGFSLEVDVELSPEVVRETEEEIARRRAVFEEAKPERAARVTEAHLRYALAVEYRPREKVLAVRDEQLLALKRSGEARDSRAPFLSLLSAKRALGLRLEGQPARPAEFALGLPHTIVSRPQYAPHYPHVEAFRRELLGWRFHRLDPRAMRADSDLKVASAPGPNGEDLPAFLDTLRARHPERFEAVQQGLREFLPAVERVDVERSDDGYLRLSVREAGQQFSARLMSEGTLRLLGLLAALEPATSATVLGLEEPEASVHAQRIGALVRRLRDARGAQVIVNTHSPVLASLVPDESLILCRKGPEGTRFSSLEGVGPLFKPSEIERALAELG